ncbi:RNA polymerase sigma factor [Nocardioides donggukensis]|uniref:Sigma-70 family RNA polymerase sigma factor n=1 Tax=Nocardioides donggukensis TaxID=2774019 RepID=A0A927Q188_9ACTN|nr:sigma-70 family RNA polymerase sigma factor [Nocardioides donggukensis]MBD8869792.1 sigma-70 family RNA polymerase sigma factor [Nocardioides donggukensis]
MPPTQFARLLAAACCGEQWAFTDLWAAYAPRIHGFVRARGSADPEALTNDVFLAVFSRIEQFNGGPDAFAALLFTVTRRRLVDEQRRRGRRPTEHEWCPEEDLRVTASAEESVLDRAAAAEARALLQALSPEQRDVLLLRIYGDLSIDRTAQSGLAPLVITRSAQSGGALMRPTKHEQFEQLHELALILERAYPVTMPLPKDASLAYVDAERLTGLPLPAPSLPDRGLPDRGLPSVASVRGRVVRWLAGLGLVGQSLIGTSVALAAVGGAGVLDVLPEPIQRVFDQAFTQDIPILEEESAEPAPTVPAPEDTPGGLDQDRAGDPRLREDGRGNRDGRGDRSEGRGTPSPSDGGPSATGTGGATTSEVPASTQPTPHQPGTGSTSHPDGRDRDKDRAEAEKDAAEDAAGDAKDAAEDAAGDNKDAAEDAAGDAKDAAEEERDREDPADD